MILPVVAEVPRDGGPQVRQPRAREDARQHEVAPLLVGVEPVAARPDDGYEHHGDEAHRHHLLGALPTQALPGQERTFASASTWPDDRAWSRAPAVRR